MKVKKEVAPETGSFVSGRIPHVLKKKVRKKMLNDEINWNETLRIALELYLHADLVLAEKTAKS